MADGGGDLPLIIKLGTSLSWICCLFFIFTFFVDRRPEVHRMIGIIGLRPSLATPFPRGMRCRSGDKARHVRRGA